MKITTTLKNADCPPFRNLSCNSACYARAALPINKKRGFKTALNILCACAFLLALPSAAIYGENYGATLCGASFLFCLLASFAGDCEDIK